MMMSRHNGATWNITPRTIGRYSITRNLTDSITTTTTTTSALSSSSASSASSSSSSSFYSKRSLSETAAAVTAGTEVRNDIHSHIEEERPTGTLFQLSKAPIGPELIGARGMIRRTFGPRSNAEGLLATGGPDLAAHASFDPDYHRAQDWIRHHAVGPAVLSPILISGLTGALTEAAFPHGVITYQSMKHVRPLIVGVPVASIIEVVSVTKAERIKPTMEQDEHDNINNHNRNNNDDDDDDDKNPSKENDDHHQQQQRTHGYDVTLRTIVSRVRDDCIIAEGIHELWVPDYLRM